MPCDRSPRIINNDRPKGRTRGGQQRDFWMCETGTGHQVTQHHDSCMMMMMMIFKWILKRKGMGKHGLDSSGLQ